MKLLVDENISPKIVKFLEKDHDVEAVRDLLPGAEDPQIVERAISEKRAILTQDKDLGHLWYFSRRGALKVIVLRPKVQSVENLKQILNKFISDIESYEENALLSLTKPSTG